MQRDAIERLGLRAAAAGARAARGGAARRASRGDAGRPEPGDPGAVEGDGAGGGAHRGHRRLERGCARRPARRSPGRSTARPAPAGRGPATSTGTARSPRTCATTSPSTARSSPRTAGRATAAAARQVQRDLVLAIDQSASMAASVVYASVFGAVLASLRALRTRVVAFDTAVVDLTDAARRPRRAALRRPARRRHRHRPGARLLRRASSSGRATRSSCSSATSTRAAIADELLRRAAARWRRRGAVVALLALADDGAPAYDRRLAAALAGLGVPAFACTPDAFPELLAAAIDAATTWPSGPRARGSSPLPRTLPPDESRRRAVPGFVRRARRGAGGRGARRGGVLLWHGEADLAGCDAVLVPGGFSYGDYLRCGAIARFAPVMGAVAEFAARGGPVLGICNGFQVLCEAGLLPGALTRNAGLRFVHRRQHVVVEADCAWTRGLPAGTVLQIPVKHGEGRYVHDDPQALAAGRAGRRPLLRRDRCDHRRGQPQRQPGRDRRGDERPGQRRRPHAPPRARRRPAAGLHRRPPAARRGARAGGLGAGLAPGEEPVDRLGVVGEGPALGDLAIAHVVDLGGAVGQ